MTKNNKHNRRLTQVFAYICFNKIDLSNIKNPQQEQRRSNRCECLCFYSRNIIIAFLDSQWWYDDEEEIWFLNSVETRRQLSIYKRYLISPDVTKSISHLFNLQFSTIEQLIRQRFSFTCFPLKIRDDKKIWMTEEIDWRQPK